MEKHYETGEVGRIEDDNHVLNVRAVFLHVLSEILGNLAVTLEKVLTGHTLLARSTA